ncbi:hypothetical protein [Streptomyces sp. CT34]|uniref:hypothetical protein n=1 Tax=Streptomyces sp. CT34 TaxID=1553907 RepID=UPI0005B7A2F1|nr:hypothetical protein [Streptomyces sp. CT34]
MRTRIAAGLATAALAGTVGLTAVAPASAAPAVPAQHTITAQKAHAADAPPGWILRDKYWTHSGCEEAGQDGIQRQHWDQYQCANGNAQWVLWTNR